MKPRLTSWTALALLFTGLGFLIGCGGGSSDPFGSSGGGGGGGGGGTPVDQTLYSGLVAGTWYGVTVSARMDPSATQAAGPMDPLPGGGVSTQVSVNCTGVGPDCGVLTPPGVLPAFHGFPPSTTWWLDTCTGVEPCPTAPTMAFGTKAPSGTLEFDLWVNAPQSVTPAVQVEWGNPSYAWGPVSLMLTPASYTGFVHYIIPFASFQAPIPSTPHSDEGYAFFLIFSGGNIPGPVNPPVFSIDNIHWKSN